MIAAPGWMLGLLGVLLALTLRAAGYHRTMDAVLALLTIAFLVQQLGPRLRRQYRRGQDAS